jgi:hypothetical protein
MKSGTFRVVLSLSIAAAMAVVVVHGAPQGPQSKPAQTKPFKMPPAVQSAFKQAYPDAVIKNVNHETEDGVEQYEVESTNHGRGLDVNYKPDGTLLVVEEEVTQDELPAAVATAISTRYAKATIALRERMTEKGKTSFEVTLKGAPVKTVQLAPDGTWISPKSGK